MKMLRVNTIYPSFMGEVNIHGIGAPCTFVRLAGCNLRCYYRTKHILCDTPEALEMKSGTKMSVDEILYKIKSFGRKVVCLTGGEPLMQDVTELLVELYREDFYVVVETNGSKSITPYYGIPNVSFVVDVKSGSSGESERMIEENYTFMDDNDFLKFVIDTDEDYKEFYSWVLCHDYLECNIAVGTFWGSKITYDYLIRNIDKDFKVPVYLNMQTHKMACMYDCYKDYASFRDLFIPKDL